MKGGGWGLGTGGWRLGAGGRALIGIVSVTTLGFSASSRAQAPADGWRTFSGTWSATGTRQTLPTDHGVAAVARVSGAIVLSTDGGVGVGFSADAMGFDDGAGTVIGRAVWTDSRGDRLFSSLRGEPLQTGRRINGTITGGTGRWAGATGDYTLTWQFVVAGEGDTIQGRSTDLRGRVRMAEGSR